MKFSFKKLKERGFSISKSFRVGPKPLDIQHVVRKELQRAKLTATLQKVETFLNGRLTRVPLPNAPDLLLLREEVHQRLVELEEYED